MLESAMITERILGKYNPQILRGVRYAAPYYENIKLSTCSGLHRHALKTAKSCNKSPVEDICSIKELIKMYENFQLSTLFHKTIGYNRLARKIAIANLGGPPVKRKINKLKGKERKGKGKISGVMKKNRLVQLNCLSTLSMSMNKGSKC